jgi:hypothetical protein
MLFQSARWFTYRGHCADDPSLSLHSNNGILNRSIIPLFARQFQILNQHSNTRILHIMVFLDENNDYSCKQLVQTIYRGIFSPIILPRSSNRWIRNLSRILLNPPIKSSRIIPMPGQMAKFTRILRVR